LKHYHLLLLVLVAILATMLIGCSGGITITENLLVTTTTIEPGPTNTITSTTTTHESGPTTTITSTTTTHESGSTTTITSTTTTHESGPTHTVTQTMTTTVTLTTTVTASPQETPPSVFTGGAIDITTSSVTLEGNLIGMGTASNVIVFFEIGETIGGPYTLQTYKEIMSSPGAFGTSLFGLSASKTYYYRAVAIGGGSSWGDEKVFRTRSS